MSNQELKKIREELEKSNERDTQRRSFLNPMYWIGLTFYITGFLICCTIIGIPIGLPMIQGGRAWMYKNYSKNTGL